MYDGEFDGIIIGGGYNGLTTAGYLAKAGLKILVLERRMSYGGATITEEVTKPGFYHNLHANFIWSYGPPHQDMELHRYGLKMMYGEAERAYLFSDGASLITYTDDPYRTYQNFSQLLPKSDLDAMEDVFHRFLTKVEEEFYAPPKPTEERGQGLPDDDRKLYQEFCDMTGREVLTKLYGSDRLRTWASMNACVRGMPDFAPGTGDFFLRYAASPKLGIVRGGTRQLAHALAAFFHQHGGTILNGYHVEEIVMDGERAVGVKCANGASFRASKFVASGVRSAHHVPGVGGGGQGESGQSWIAARAGSWSSTRRCSGSTPRPTWRRTTPRSIRRTRTGPSRSSWAWTRSPTSTRIGARSSRGSSRPAPAATPAATR